MPETTATRTASGVAGDTLVVVLLLVTVAVDAIAVVGMALAGIPALMLVVPSIVASLGLVAFTALELATGNAVGISIRLLARARLCR